MQRWCCRRRPEECVWCARPLSRNHACKLACVHQMHSSHSMARPSRQRTAPPPSPPSTPTMSAPTRTVTPQPVRMRWKSHCMPPRTIGVLGSAAHQLRLLSVTSRGVGDGWFSRAPAGMFAGAHCDFYLLTCRCTFDKLRRRPVCHAPMPLSFSFPSYNFSPFHPSPPFPLSP